MLPFYKYISWPYTPLTPNTPPKHFPAPTKSSQKIPPTPKPIPSKDLATCIWVQIYFCFKSTHSMIRARIRYQCTPHWLPNCNDRSTFVTPVTHLWRYSIRNDENMQEDRNQDSECERLGILASHLRSQWLDIYKHVSGGFTAKWCNWQGYDRNKQLVSVVWKVLQDVQGRNPPPKFQQKGALGQVRECRVETCEIY